ncbi:MAG: type IV secretory system conjugative DNA transfer family protein [Oscillospiraceae bacterium]|nr:type IV secretory system conjugative DNA transfer family protein [Oscillospiraceae bacterium]
MKTVRAKSTKPKFIVTAIFSLIVAYFGNRLGEIFAYSYGDILYRIEASIGVFHTITDNPLHISFHETALIVTAIGFSVVWLGFISLTFSAKKYMRGVEHGSSEWGTSHSIKGFVDTKPTNNLILTSTESLSLSGRMKNPTYNRNKNVLIVGGSGTGKTRFYVKPNLMQMHSSYVVTDPKGSLFHETGKMFADADYKIKVFNLKDMDASDFYNPFEYIETEDDILKLINNLIANTNPDKKGGGDPFWEKSETALLMAIFSYLVFECPPSDRTFSEVLNLIRMAEVREDDDTFQSPLDLLFEELKQEKPHCFAVKEYQLFKQAAGKTAKGILISVGVRLAPFDIERVGKLLSKDTLELYSLGDERTILYIILPDTDKTFNFIAAMMYQQLFDILVRVADKQKGARLKHHVRFILDEFSNIGQIPGFEILVSTIRSREMSVSIILQTISQLKSLYRDDKWETIAGNCDTWLFLGGSEQSTLELISKKCGKTTIDHRNINESHGQTRSYSKNYQVLGRELLLPDEVARIERTECILLISGCNPWLSQKYDIELHPNYRRLLDYNDDNWYDISLRDAERHQKKEEQTILFFDNVIERRRLDEILDPRDFDDIPTIELAPDGVPPTTRTYEQQTI